MEDLFKRLPNGAERMVFILGYGIAFALLVSGFNTIFGPPYDNPENIGHIVQSGFSKIVLGTFLALVVWVISEKIWPWIRQRIHRNH